jgi:hypothetical protein
LTTFIKFFFKTAVVLALAVGTNFSIHAHEQASTNKETLETTSNCSDDCAEIVHDLLGQNVDVDDACDQVCEEAPAVKDCKGKCVGWVKRGMFFSEVCTNVCGAHRFGSLRGGAIFHTELN